jgi:signal transduction histidine kinase
MLFESKYTSLINQASLIASSLSPLNTLKEDEVGKVMNLLNDMNLERIIVTDSNARIVYDSIGSRASLGKYVLFPEVVKALGGKDVFYSKFTGSVISSRACLPVLSEGNITGTVYIYEYDSQQAELIESLRKNILKISAVAFLAAMVLSQLLSRIMTVKLRSIVKGIKSVGAGSYGHRISVKGRDELSQLAEEFNLLADRLQKTEEMRLRFVSDASHELKTPLSGIMLLSDSIVQNDKMDRETIRDFVYDIGKEAERLSRVTQRLLELTRLNNRRNIALLPVDVKKVVTEAMKILNTLAVERRVTLTGSLDDNCIILADSDLLHQIIFNLTENAIKYNVENGSVTLLLFKKNKEVRFIVDDTGIGMPEESIPFIFDRFYRVDESRSGDRGGSGLGLSIVKDAVLKLGGTVTASLRKQGGMRFEVVFPLYDGSVLNVKPLISGGDT